MTDKVTQISIVGCLDEALSYMEGLAPSEAVVRNALDEVESRLGRLRFAVLTRGLEGAEPTPVGRLIRDDKGNSYLRIVE